MGKPTCLIPFRPTVHCVVRTVMFIKEHQVSPLLFFAENLTLPQSDNDSESDNESDTDMDDVQHGDKDKVFHLLGHIRDHRDEYLFHFIKQSGQEGEEERKQIKYNYVAEKLDGIVDPGGVEHEYQNSVTEENVQTLAHRCANVAAQVGLSCVAWPEELSDPDMSQWTENEKAIQFYTLTSVDDPVTELFDLCADDQCKVDEYMSDVHELTDPDGLMDKVEEVTGLHFKPHANIFAILGKDYLQFDRDDGGLFDDYYD